MDKVQNTPLPFVLTDKQLEKVPKGATLSFRETIQRTPEGLAYRAYVAEYYDEVAKRYVYVGSKRIEKLKGNKLKTFESAPRERKRFERLNVAHLTTEDAGTVIKHGAREKKPTKPSNLKVYNCPYHINRWHILSALVMATVTEGIDSFNSWSFFRERANLYREAQFYGDKWCVDRLPEEALLYLFLLHQDGGFFDIDEEGFEKVASELRHSTPSGPAPVSTDDPILFSSYENQYWGPCLHLLLGLDPETEKTFMPLMWFWGMNLAHSLVTAREDNADPQIAYAVLEAGGNYCFEIGSGPLQKEIKNYLYRAMTWIRASRDVEVSTDREFEWSYHLLPADKFKPENTTLWPGLTEGTVAKLSRYKKTEKGYESSEHYFVCSLGYEDEKTPDRMEEAFCSMPYLQEPSPFLYDIMCETKQLKARNPTRLAFEAKLEFLRKKLGDHVLSALEWRGFPQPERERPMFAFERKVKRE